MLQLPNAGFDLGVFHIVGSQFDFKRATLWIRDGYSASPAINLTAGYSAGATSFTIDGLTGFLRVGQQFTVTGSTLTHTITGVTSDSTTTTAIQFSPQTDVAVSDDDTIAVGPHRLEVILGEGTFSYTVRTPKIYTRNRGVLSEVRNDNEEPLEVTMEANWEFITGISPTPTITDALRKIGAASDWVSSDTDTCRPYAVDLLLDYDPVCEGVLGEEITFPDFRLEEMGPNANDGVLSISGRCNVVWPTAVRQ